MEPKKLECLENLREHIAEFLDNISEIGSAINKKSKTLLREISNINHEDIKSIEKIGLGMVKMLKTLNINVIDITNLLENDLKNVNENHNEELFKDLCLKILEYKKSFLTNTTSDNITLKLNTFLDKGTQTDCNNDIPNASGLQPKLKHREIKPEEEGSSAPDINDTSTIKDLKLRTKDIVFALVRTDTQDTEDCWVDSINRSPSALELWNRKYQGEKNNITGNIIHYLKEILSNIIDSSPICFVQEY